MVQLILLVGIGFIVVMTVSVYNKLISHKNLVKNAFSQIDVQLKRRYDLIPNLVETAKGFLTHESQTLENVIKARNSAFSASQALGGNPANSANMKTLMNSESNLSQSLGKLMVVFEAYPDLKGQANMQTLMEELTSTENKISFARQSFNDSVMEYNNAREVFPNNLLASYFKFEAVSSWEISNSSERENVQVKFG